MNKDSSKQHIIITGTTKGLGNHLCSQLLEQGHFVTGFARSEVPGKFTNYIISGNYKHVVADLADLNNIDLVFDSVLNEKATVLIINAADYLGAEQMNEAVFLRQANLNLLFPVMLIQRIISAKQDVPLKIIFVSSVMAIISDKKNPMYGAAKAAISHFIDGIELHHFHNISFLKVTAGPMHEEKNQESFIRQILSLNYATASAIIIRNIGTNKGEIFIPNVWRYLVCILRITGGKRWSLLVNNYR